MKTRNYIKKLSLNKKTIVNLTFDRMKTLRGGIPGVTDMCNTLRTGVWCCTVYPHCGDPNLVDRPTIDC